MCVQRARTNVHPLQKRFTHAVHLASSPAVLTFADPARLAWVAEELHPRVHLTLPTTETFSSMTMMSNLDSSC